MLPRPLAHLSNTPGKRPVFELASPAGFSYRTAEWAAQAASGAVRYDLTFNTAKSRWYLDCSWTSEPAAAAQLDSLRRSPVLAVDLNADHLACHVVASDGNPVGRPITVECGLDGPTARRNGQMRAAICALLDTAEANGCRSIAIEDLGFDDARSTGRETMGRGRRGKRFRRTVAGMPTARFKAFLATMAHRRGIAVVAVDPAYTTRWGKQHWLGHLNNSRTAHYTGHHAATIIIGRRCQGHRARQRGHSRGRTAAAGPTHRQSTEGKPTARRPVEPEPPGRDPDRETACRTRPTRREQAAPKKRSRDGQAGEPDTGQTCRAATVHGEHPTPRRNTKTRQK